MSVIRNSTHFNISNKTNKFLEITVAADQNSSFRIQHKSLRQLRQSLSYQSGVTIYKQFESNLVFNDNENTGSVDDKVAN